MASKDSQWTFPGHYPQLVVGRQPPQGELNPSPLKNLAVGRQPVTCFSGVQVDPYPGFQGHWIGKAQLVPLAVVLLFSSREWAIRPLVCPSEHVRSRRASDEA